MPDDLLNQRDGAHGHGRRTGRWGTMLFMALAGFALGGGAVGWMALHSDWHLGPEALRHLLTSPAQIVPAAPSATPDTAPGALVANQSALDARIVAAEQRLDHLDIQAAAAAGNAARAEGLLVAFAARRVIERGASLGYLENQLKLRFGDAQPHAVATLIETAHSPVTLDMLTARLQVMAKQMDNAPPSETLWDRTRRELSNMMIIRRDTASGPTPAARLDHALACLHEGAVEPALADVQRLPATSATASWIADAHRYAEAENALDRIETAALLEPHALGDGTGRKVAQPSPLAPPQLNTQPGATSTPARR